MHFSVLEVDLTKNQISAKTLKKCGTMSSTLFHLSESGKLFIKKRLKKTSLTETGIELFSTLRFSACIKHRGSVSVTARQQTYCKRNFEQVPSPSDLRKAKYGTVQFQETAGETLERP